jgi:gamma-glutamyltranspeptidase / glutathione hydrolase
MAKYNRPTMKNPMMESGYGWRVATGHSATTSAARTMLEAGGNAADAAIAATLAATVAEPMLCSLGGGGHALVQVEGRAPVSLDCFTHTPRHCRAEPLDFYPIIGNFGTDIQEFHVGMAAIATPGLVAGLFALAERYGRMPMTELIRPAARLAREGVALNATQHYTLNILEPIVRASKESARLFGLANRQDPIPAIGSRIGNPPLADFLEELARQGEAFFYHGEPARRLAEDSVHSGGHLTLADLGNYRIRWRRPLRWHYRKATVWSTPPPAFGGMMLALACANLADNLAPDTDHGSPQHAAALCQAMKSSEDLRRQLEKPELLGSARSLRQAFSGLTRPAAVVQRGTTHISVEDGNGLAVSMTLSNGEGSGYVLPGTGIILNNMLGEEDINRTGFHTWPANRRLASMMAPTILRRQGHRWLLGSGGSNRIRTALVQAISGIVDFDLSLDQAIGAPRMHLEGDRLAIETPVNGWPEHTLAWLAERYPQARHWPERNMYFGGVHATGPDGAVADPRRGGEAAVESMNFARTT